MSEILLWIHANHDQGHSHVLIDTVRRQIQAERLILGPAALSFRKIGRCVEIKLTAHQPDQAKRAAQQLLSAEGLHCTEEADDCLGDVDVPDDTSAFAPHSRPLQVWKYMLRMGQASLSASDVGAGLKISRDQARKALLALEKEGIAERSLIPRCGRGSPSVLYQLSKTGREGLPSFATNELKPPPSWYRLLKYLSMAKPDQPMFIRDIVPVIGVSGSQAHKLMQHLVSQGHAQETAKVHMAGKKPCIGYGLTPAGIEAAQEATLDPTIYAAWGPK